jgi:hypothetical protein
MKMLQDPEMVRQMMAGTQEAVQAAEPSIPIEVIEVPPPIQMRGSLELYISFEYSSIANLTEKEIKQRVYDTLYGERSRWLPQVELGELKLWREKVRATQEAARSPGINPGAGAGTSAGVNLIQQRLGLHELRDRGDQENAGDSPVGGQSGAEEFVNVSDGPGPLHDHGRHPEEDSSSGNDGQGP